MGLEVRCPAGAPVNPPGEGEGLSVICGVLERENALSPEALTTKDSTVSALVSFRNEPSSVLGYCCSARGYQNCPVWRAEVARRDKRADRLQADDCNYGGIRNRY